ncbi:alkaline phosphatase family protein [Natrialbaceae archaeon AArc-T1-2]|uniref:alkaline phosphatase family protein n=1 Tax=Natrialbaceae archaeon AArc-T1-2 TaxID=3053904 RepID=UPI00255AD6EB|nr:alkaline phosphatase family protein [Natrialbaceae archaeon AArc-T1-2]WIV67855.1 alkaline phosphatase family protein [Natrialbaceae archaeon AArc-T1-2]
MSGSTYSSDRAFVLGIDGVPWRFIERWTDAGELPNFARLREEGAAGPLESTRPPTTPLAWPSIATGVWPDKHGIYGFQNLASDYTHRMHTSRDCTQPPLWEQLSPALVGNVPMTYPPTEIDGTVVAGMMTPSTDAEFTHPPAFADEIERQIPDYQISLEYPEYADRLEEFQVAIDELLANRRELMQLLMDRTDDWQLCFFVFTAPDRLQHLIWDETTLRAHYRQLDEIVGDAIAYADDHDADLYVVSDHGFGPLERLVYVNRILEREGYLTRRDEDGTRGALASLGVSRDAVRRVLNAVGISEEQLVSMLPREFVDSVASQLPGDHELYDVDYEETTAFVHGAGSLYVNDVDRFERGIVPPEQVPRIKRELTDLLESVVDPETGEQALCVFDGDELFPTDDGSPDLVVNGRGAREIRTALTDEPFGETGTYTASHRSEGVVLCRGPAIEPGSDLRSARVVDVAPTLLHGIGEPVPSNADGRVLFDAFRDGSPPATTGVERADVSRATGGDDVDDDFSDVEDRLKGLGYME